LKAWFADELHDELHAAIVLRLCKPGITSGMQCLATRCESCSPSERVCVARAFVLVALLLQRCIATTSWKHTCTKRCSRARLPVGPLTPWNGKFLLRWAQDPVHKWSTHLEQKACKAHVMWPQPVTETDPCCMSPTRAFCACNCIMVAV
jgi:hypothetical protein